MAPKVEILAHISAPSLLKDDKRHRDQVQGFLNFKAVRRLALATREEPQQNSPQHHITELHELNNISFETADSWQDETFVPSRTSRAKKDGSHGLDGPDVPQVIQLRLPSGPTMPEAVQVTRTPHQRSITAPIVPSASFNISNPRRSSSDSWEAPLSVVPDSQPANLVYEQDLLGDSPEEVPVLVTPLTTSILISPPIKRRRQEVATPTRDERNKPDQMDAQQSPMHPRNGQKPHLRVPLPIAARTPENVPGLPTEVIEPPSPRIALHPFSTHITDSLKALEKESSLATKFRPKYFVRTPETLDRGYWEVKLTRNWESEKRARFWGFIKKFIGEGRAGWGVKCERYTLTPSKGSSDVATEDDLDEEEPDDLIRIYCWGEVVGHIYLVLHIASSGRVKGTCAQWFDAQGEVVIQMA